MTHNEDGSVTFTLTNEQWDKYIKWRKKLPDLCDSAFGAAGGGYEFVFTPTGLGTVELVRRCDSKSIGGAKKKDKEINLTDFSHW